MGREMTSCDVAGVSLCDAGVVLGTDTAWTQGGQSEDGGCPGAERWPWLGPTATPVQVRPLCLCCARFCAHTVFSLEWLSPCCTASQTSRLRAGVTHLQVVPIEGHRPQLSVSASRLPEPILLQPVIYLCLLLNCKCLDISQSTNMYTQWELRSK